MVRRISGKTYLHTPIGQAIFVEEFLYIADQDQNPHPQDATFDPKQLKALKDFQYMTKMKESIEG
ncbi:unnamed protein product [Prunus armeniaca]|uniref:Uncharacterized protein n=1 Tax=Prunus armeniaca TaxID=36596 RepID=A0A6J5UN50_PRUAR|nr:unnamed protein product [Prunus armeniaca]